MGSDRLAPGKISAAHVAYNAQPETVAVPGKSTLVDQRHATGVESIDTAGMGACADAAGAECFLTPAQRIELNSEYADRVGSVQSAYLSALGSLELEQKIKKPDELGFFLRLLVAALPSAIEFGLGKGLVQIMKHGAARRAVDSIFPKATAIAGAAVAPAKSASGGAAGAQAEHAVRTLSKRELDVLVKTSIDTARDKLKGQATSSSSDSAATRDKAHALDYIGWLRDQSMVVFQHIREDPKASATDAQMLALREAMEGSFHTPGHYQEVLGAAIERYLASPASEIGRHAEVGTHGRVEKETRLVWVIMNGRRELAYRTDEFEAWYQTLQETHRGHVERSGAYDAGENQLSLAQSATWRIEGREVQRAETPVATSLPIRYVEPEFRELALEKQEKVWMQKPETFMYDPRSMPPTLKKVAS